MLRDNEYLTNLMYFLWENHFNDVERKNKVIIKFGRASKRQLGCIKWVTDKTRVKTILKNVRKYFDDDQRITLITITSLFKDERVPEFVIKATVAHEIIHYAHGFYSPLKKLYNHPHKGGIIAKEMRKRDLGEILKQSKSWLKTNWKEFCK